jgi:hypothetical protein
MTGCGGYKAIFQKAHYHSVPLVLNAPLHFQLHPFLEF